MGAGIWQVEVEECPAEGGGPYKDFLFFKHSFVN